MHCARSVGLGIALGVALGLSLAPARADGPVARVEGNLPGDLRERVEAVLERVEAPARSRAQARRRAERAAEQLRAVLNSEGYYDPNIQARIADEPDGESDDDPGLDPPLTPILTVEPGPRYTVGEARVEFVPDILDSAEAAREQLDLPTGTPVESERVIAAGLRVSNWLTQHGYPEARVTDREVVLDHDRDTLDVLYPVAPGPKVRFGDVKLGGDARLMRSWVDMITPFEAGDVFDARELDTLTTNVSATGVFDQAVASLEQTDTPNADGTITRNVLLNIAQGDKNTISGSVGYSTTEGSGVEVIYERRNFVGYAQTLTLRGVVRTNEIGLGVNYFIPYFLSVDRTLTGDLEAVRQNTDEFDGERVTARALVGEQISERFRIGYGLGLEASRFEQNDIEREAYVVDAVGTAAYDARNNRLDPTRGFIVSGEAVPSYNFGDESAFFTRVDLGGAVYQRVHPEFVLAGRLDAGTLFGTSLDNIPFNRRFYAGGGGSVRGFAFQSIGPRDALDLPTGGRSLLEGSVEARWRSRTLFDGNLGGAVFVDAATVAVPSLSDFRDIRYGAGVGVRYYTAFAPLRADIAIPLNPRDGDDAFQIYISIGQAF